MTSQFSADQYEVAYPDGAEHHWWHVARNEIVLDACPPPRGRILDVGCGRGIVVEYLRRHGIDCIGVELGPVTPLRGVENFVHAETDAFELPPSEREQIATILLLDIVEHLENPADFLRRLPAAFPNLRDVIVTVPARPELWSNHDEYYGHYRRYTIPRLADIASALNAECRRRSYFFRMLYPPVWLMSRLKMKREVALKPPAQPALHKIIAKLFVLEYRLLPRRVAGTSIVAAFALRRAAPSGRPSPAGPSSS